MIQNSWFITGSQDIPGNLANAYPDLMEEGFLFFVRLITLDTPCPLYMSLSQDGVAPVKQHKRFIIGECVE